MRTTGLRPPATAMAGVSRPFCAEVASMCSRPSVTDTTPAFSATQVAASSAT